MRRLATIALVALLVAAGTAPLAAATASSAAGADVVATGASGGVPVASSADGVLVADTERGSIAGAGNVSIAGTERGSIAGSGGGPAAVAGPADQRFQTTGENATGRNASGENATGGARLSAAVATQSNRVSGSFEAALVRVDLEAEPSTTARAERLDRYEARLDARLRTLAASWQATVTAHRAGELDDATYRFRLARIAGEARALAGLSSTAAAQVRTIPPAVRNRTGLNATRFHAIRIHGRAIAGNASALAGDGPIATDDEFVIGPRETLEEDGTAEIDGESGLEDGSYSYEEFRREYENETDDSLEDAVDEVEDGLEGSLTEDGGTPTATATESEDLLDGDLEDDV